MSQTDPIADMLAIIRNALERGRSEVSIPYSRMKEAIARIMKQEGYIEDYSVEQDNKQGILKIKLKYLGKYRPVIRGLKKVSKPGRRVYCTRDEIPRVLDGMGIAIISTSRGILSDREAEKLGVGGEVICYIW